MRSIYCKLGTCSTSYCKFLLTVELPSVQELKKLESVQFYQTVVFQQVGLPVRKAVLPSIKSLTETGELINVWLEKKYGVCDLPANYSLCFLDPPKQSMYIPNILS